MGSNPSKPVLNSVSPEGNSALRQLNHDFTIQEIQKEYNDEPINKIQVLESPVKNKLVQIIDSIIPGNFYHWGLLITFSKNLYWSIDFCAQGLQCVISLKKQKLIQLRKDNRITRQSPVRENRKVYDVIVAIKQVQTKNYIVGSWNCQHFATHIMQRLK